MKFHILKIPIYWVCEPCKSKCESTSPSKEDQGISSKTSKMHQTDKAGKDEVMRLSSGSASCSTLSIWKPIVGSNSFPIPYSNLPVSFTKVLGEHPRNDEIHKKTMTSKHASCPLSKGEIFPQPLLSSLFFYFLVTFTIHVLILKNRILSGG